MSGQLISPCLWLDNDAEEAAAFYTQLFPRGRVVSTSRYPESVDNPGKMPRGSVLTVEFEIAGQRFTALNGGPLFEINPTISFFVQVEDPREVDRYFAAFADGGKVLMPADKYPWSERYAWVEDRFGVSLQVIAGRPEGSPVIVPCLMFSGRNAHRAEEAMTFFTSVFPDSRIGRIERYAKGEGPEDMVKHGRFVIAGQEFVAMDSHVEHDFNFNEGLSLQVACKGQAELDRYWNALSEGGEKSQCGWLKDRFGISWQTVPNAMSAWMTAPDDAARARVFTAMLPMQHLDVGALKHAFDGR